MMRLRYAAALLAAASACLLPTATQHAAALSFGISAAGAATVERGIASNQPSCGAVLDAKGAKVSQQGASGQVVTSASHPCAAPELTQTRVASNAHPAPHAAAPAKPVQSEAIAGLSAEPVPRAIGPQDGPLRFAAENPERVGAALLTGSAMLWVLHSSFWTSLLMLGLPLWRHVDLLPIVASTHDDEVDAALAPPTPEESAVAHMLEERGAGAPVASRQP